MRSMFLMVLCLLPICVTKAQVEVEDPSLMQVAEVAQPSDSLVPSPMLYAPDVPTGISLQDTPWGYRPFTFSACLPMGYMGSWGGGLWNLHQGFNASVSAGIHCGFGRNNPWRGAAFFTDLTAAYAMPVGKRWTLAGGLDYTRYTGWGQSQGSLGIFGLANCRINEKLDATAFISHSFGPLGVCSNRMGATPYVPGISGACTTVGADLGIKINEAVKVNVGVSFTREENPYAPPFPPAKRTTP